MVSSIQRRAARALLLSVGFLQGLAGCAASPPLQANGLPRISRYTNRTQLEWALSSYRTAAQGDVAQAQPASRVEEACLGYEQMVFDLKTAKRYPMIFRLSVETSNLAGAIDALPEVLQHVPYPSACAQLLVERIPPDPPNSTPALTPSPAAAEVPQRATEAGSVASAAAGPSPTGPATTASSAEQTKASSLGASAGQSASLPSAPPPSTAVQTAPAATGLALAGSNGQTPVVAPPPASKWQAERLSLWKLASALRWKDQTGTVGSAAAVDLATLSALANQESPTVRLRARYHLLGLCVAAVDAYDRFGRVPPDQPGCAGAQAGESLRTSQARLLRSMLSVWRGRHPEPLNDLVVALASYAARDNPILDGPRIAR